MKPEPQQLLSTIDTAKVREIAHLAHLSFSEAETAALSKQLTTIIDHFKLLQEAKVEGVLSTNTLQAGNTELRPDVVIPSFDSEEFLSHLPQRKGRYIQVAPALPKMRSGSNQESGD